MARHISRPKAPLVLDARYTHTGTYSAWLCKDKSDGAKGKWFSSTCRRYFTIDFDAQVLSYASSDTQKHLSVKVKFHEIVKAIVGSASPVASSSSGGLRRSLSGMLSKGGGQGLAAAGVETPFVLHLLDRVVQLWAESQADSVSWVDMLNTAARMGQEQAMQLPAACTLMGPSPTEIMKTIGSSLSCSDEDSPPPTTCGGGISSCSGLTTPTGDAPSEDAFVELASDAGRVGGLALAERGEGQPPEAGDANLGRGQVQLGFLLSAYGQSDASTEDGSEIEIEIGELPAGPCTDQRTEESLSSAAALAATEAAGPPSLQHAWGEDEGGAQSGGRQRQEAKRLSAADFGFDDVDLSGSDAECEAEPSPVATPRNLLLCRSFAALGEEVADIDVSGRSDAVPTEAAAVPSEAEPRRKKDKKKKEVVEPSDDVEPRRHKERKTKEAAEPADEAEPRRKREKKAKKDAAEPSEEAEPKRHRDTKTKEEAAEPSEEAEPRRHRDKNKKEEAAAAAPSEEAEPRRHREKKTKKEESAEPFSADAEPRRHKEKKSRERVVEPVAETCSTGLEDRSDDSDSEVEADHRRRDVSRIAADLLLVAKGLVAAEAKSGSKKKASRHHEERETRIAADLMLAQGVRMA